MGQLEDRELKNGVLFHFKDSESDSRTSVKELGSSKARIETVLLNPTTSAFVPLKKKRKKRVTSCRLTTHVLSPKL